jgi:molecular chaperone GrpE
MSLEDEFEFEIEDEDEEEERRPKKAKKSPKKKSPPKKAPKAPAKKATRNPIPDGVKRKIALDLRQIKKLKKELKEFKDEKETLEHELEMLEDEIDSLRSEKTNLEDDINKQIALANAFEKKLNRNQKDFENFKKRNKSEMDRNVKMGAKKLIIGVIDVIDNFDRALVEAKKYDYKPEVKKLIEGEESIRKSLLKVLSDNDVEMLDPIDEPFDPNFHEAIETRFDTSVPENTVVEIDSKGYMLGDIVLRPAKVYVSKGGEPRKKKSKADRRFKEEEEEDDIDDVEDMDDIEDIEEIEDIDEMESD